MICPTWGVDPSPNENITNDVGVRGAHLEELDVRDMAGSHGLIGGLQRISGTAAARVRCLELLVCSFAPWGPRGSWSPRDLFISPIIEHQCNDVLQESISGPGLQLAGCDTVLHNLVGA